VQFRALGALFHARGYNVLIPRLPRHGYRDRMSRHHGRLSRADYIACAPSLRIFEAAHLALRAFGPGLVIADDLQ